MIDQNSVDTVYNLLKQQYTILAKQRDSISRAMSINTELTLLLYRHTTPPPPCPSDLPWDT